ncbi:metallophosphoesterase family protein [Candidatus Uhrbacteria bacterium]|nr:metallophosphoesterase family protein [Candidatus Uhrbacteria bacterium]
MIFATSDLHYGLDPEGDRSVRALARKVTETACESDVLALVGDLGSDDDSVQRCLDLFGDFPGEVVAVAGNHDIWVAPGDDSWARLARVQKFFRQAGFHPLEDGPKMVGDTAFVGTIGWYDYSFRDDIGVPIEHYREKSLPGGRAMWGDAVHARWSTSDEEMTRHFASRLENHLELVRDARNIVAFVHHVPTKDLLFHPRWFIPREWRFLNAFLGSEWFADLLRRHSAVTDVVCGHIHRAAAVRRGVKRFVSIGGNYREKQLVTLDGANLRRQTFRP